MRLGLLFQKYGRAGLLVLVLLFCLYSTYLYLTTGQRGHDADLVVLSYQFLHRKIALPVINLPVRDIANYYNNYYSYFGPLGPILLMPFVLIFGVSFPEVAIGIFSMAVTFVTVYALSRQFKFDTIDSLWLSIFSVFSTVLFYSSVMGASAYQVEALGVPCILLALYAYVTKKSPLLIGFFIGLGILTRFTLMLSAAFFFFEMLQKRFTIKQFFLLLLPVIVCLSLFGAYNQRRFHSVLETGYSYSITKNSFPIGINLKYTREISVTNIPANLYSFLFMPPEPVVVDKYAGLVLKFPYLKANPWGIAIWFTSPLFLFLIVKFKKGMYSLSAGIAAILLSLPVFLWYSIGYAQYGYRYTLDFLPFLLLLLFPSLGTRLSKTAIVLIILGVLFNCFFSASIWGVYPLFNMW